MTPVSAVAIVRAADRAEQLAALDVAITRVSLWSSSNRRERASTVEALRRLREELVIAIEADRAARAGAA